MQIIDAHQHFWTYTPNEYQWIDEEMKMLRNDFLPADLEELYQINNISGCVSVQASSTEKETLELINHARQHLYIKGVVGWVDLCADKAQERLEYFKSFPPFKGVRHVISSEHDEFMQQPDFLSGIARLADLDLTYDLLIYPKHLFSAYHLCKKFPNQKFIIDHLAKPYIRLKHFDHWRDLMQNFKDLPNVFCKISGMVTEADWKKWRYPDFIPVLDTITDVFGPERMVFGSDWPVCLLAGSYKNVLDIVKTYTESWSEAEKENLFSKNAVRFYNLDL